MSLEFYKVLHIAGIAMVIMALGAAAVHSLNGGTRATNKFRVGIAATHGTGLLLILVAGFGMLARLGIMQGGLPTWVILKLVIWVFFGASLTLIFRKQRFAKSAWWLVILLTGTAAWLALMKPF